MPWGIKKNLTKKIKENPKKKHSKKPPKSPPPLAHLPIALFMHCTACPCTPRSSVPLHFIVQLPHDKCAPSGKSKSKSQQPKSKSTSRRGGNQSQKTKRKKKAETFRFAPNLGHLQRLIAPNGRGGGWGISNWPERETKSVLCFDQTTLNIVYSTNWRGYVKKSYLFSYKQTVRYKCITYTCIAITLSVTYAMRNLQYPYRGAVYAKLAWKSTARLDDVANNCLVVAVVAVSHSNANRKQTARLAQKY